MYSENSGHLPMRSARAITCARFTSSYSRYVFRVMGSTIPKLLIGTEDLNHVLRAASKNGRTDAVPNIRSAGKCMYKMTQDVGQAQIISEYIAKACCGKENTVYDTFKE